MKLSAAALLLPFLLAMTAMIANTAWASSSGAGATPTPSLLDQTLSILHLKHAPKPKSEGEIHDGVELRLAVSPAPIKLSENREITVTIDAYNRTKKYIHLNFPTSQRIEILVRDSSGKVVETWSEDQSFTNDPASVTINPDERIEYAETVATREMSGGEPYIIEASFPNYPDLKIQKQVIPEK
jgi:hypothetical protein